MKLNLCYANSCAETAQNLAEDLGCRLSKTPNSGVVNIAWGYKQDAPDGITWINSPLSIKKNTNKLLTNYVLEKKGIKVAKAYGYEEILKKFDDKEITLPIIARRGSTQGGSGFVICLSRKHLLSAIEEGYVMFKKYIPIDKEYRVHVFGDEVLFTSQKETKEIVISLNARNGINFKDIDNIDELNEIAIKSVQSANLTFGAVDILKGEDGQHYVLEVNTAPSLRDSHVKVYTLAIKKFLGKTEVVSPMMSVIKDFAKMFRR